MNLIIVESPTKAKTISHFLGKDFKVVASYGHVRDLPKSRLGIKIENNFLPEYIIPTKAKKRVNELKKTSKKAEKIILATDEDREGEAIAWHLANILKTKNSSEKAENQIKTERIVFHEITKPAIEKAIKEPRQINMDLVYAQQARRVLDRLVGYKLSPFLWRKILRGLSAGRVQSPALRLIVERERERESFKQEKYYTLVAVLEKILKGKNKETLEANLSKINGKSLPKPGIKNKEEAERIKKELENNKAAVKEIAEEKENKSPLPPFTTSTLQQTAWRLFHFPAKKTMMIAQGLYEGKNLGKGPVGLITYMRTDSFNLAASALDAAKIFIQKNLGEKYTLPKPRIFKNRSRLAQEAHEAIRPTDPFLVPESIEKYLAKEELLLYSLIWSRFLATQMPQAIIKKTSVIFEASGKKDIYELKSNFYKLEFDGFLKIYPYAYPSEVGKNFPQIKKGEELIIKKTDVLEHLTQPPPRFNDASLIKTLENFGIGRPSTYAPIISVLQERGYILRDENKAFFPSEIGILVSDFLVQHFDTIIDYQFTSQLEEKLDEIAQGKIAWEKIIKDFYEPFEENIKKKDQEISKEKLAPITTTKEKCPLCGNFLVLKLGRYGKFYACSSWPKCSYTKSQENNLSLPCPLCQKGKVVIKRSKKGKTFYACSAWPECKFISSYPPTGKNCPECGKYLVETKTKIKCSDRNCHYETLKEKIS